MWYVYACIYIYIYIIINDPFATAADACGPDRVALRLAAPLEESVLFVCVPYYIPPQAARWRRHVPEPAFAGCGVAFGGCERSSAASLPVGAVWLAVPSRMPELPDPKTSCSQARCSGVNGAAPSS